MAKRSPIASAVIAGGIFSIDVDLAEGTHDITARQTDLADNISGFSEALTIIVETTQPKVASARFVDLTHVHVTFDEPVDNGTDAGQYAISDNLNVQSVADLGENTYNLTIDSMTGGVTYTVSVDPQLADIAGNTMDPDHRTAQVTAFGIFVDTPQAPYFDIDNDHIDLMTRPSTPSTAELSGLGGSGKFIWTIDGVGSFSPECLRQNVIERGCRLLRAHKPCG